MASGNTVTVSDGAVTATYTAASGDTVQDFLDRVNTTANLKVQALLNSSTGKIELRGTGTNNIIIGGTAPNLTTALGLTAGTSSYVQNTARQSPAQQFDALLSQVDQTVRDASFDGTNLLNNDVLSVRFNETGSSALNISGILISATGLGLSAVSSGTGGRFQSDAEINTSLTQVGSAIDALASQAATFSSNNSILKVRNDLNRSMIDILNQGAALLTDSDPSEDSALMLSLQTRQQLALKAFSLAEQSGTSALRMFDQ